MTIINPKHPRKKNNMTQSKSIESSGMNKSPKNLNSARKKTGNQNQTKAIIKAPQDETKKIRELNDLLRREFMGGQIYLTEGVAAILQNERRAVITALREFDDFSPDNDPYGEHDFGAFTVAKQKYFFKISYYDKSLEYGSPDPADPKVTTRVLTLMLASEY
jgi:Protein of unknown function (DUF3768)